MSSSMKAGLIGLAIILGGGTYLGVQNRGLFSSGAQGEKETEGIVLVSGNEESTGVDVVSEVAVSSEATRDYAFEIATDDVMEIADHGQAHVDEVRALWDKAVLWYSIKNTEPQIVDAVERIYQARKYYPSLTHKQCLEYLVDHIPDEIRVNHAEYSERTSIQLDSESSTDGVEAPEPAVVSREIRMEVTSIGVDIRNVRQVAETVYKTLEDAYLEPYRLAQEEAAARQAALAQQQAAAAEVLARNAEAARQKLESRRQVNRERQVEEAERYREFDEQKRAWSEEQKRMFYGY